MFSFPRIFIGDYVNCEKEGKGEEIVGSQRIFEGEYKKGLRNGEGIEYNEYDNIIYKGTYLNGERHEKGQTFHSNDEIEFEGEFYKGKKWNGKGYDDKGNLVYELINGCGKIKEYDKLERKLEFEGEYLNGMRIGHGKIYYNYKLEFEGEILDDKKNGKNILMVS